MAVSTLRNAQLLLEPDTPMRCMSRFWLASCDATSVPYRPVMPWGRSLTSSSGRRPAVVGSGFLSSEGGFCCEFRALAQTFEPNYSSKLKNSDATARALLPACRRRLLARDESERAI